ncbi:FKBP-type peptidyl-prolyl cis-trans isomerase family protein [Ehrlichia chaffeensis str. Heartland]|uniref:Uncharacterized protein n=1 Tax=Ehrlichia chaffeensis (strain ATCC CRL-10679 / Arkansas) TaxID=205920 RepID=Q2GH11_EHRCR|nr:hypothetical protein [Ehrlichia chaffeensis]ABD45448.1 conserved hypothetical protein [Ehrlichia chaffeensis str. Arkansas]AHX03553.1 FKBP-type peptidyl-prolyl cis-trans isomerase family protein [Ehrlichia chaffeensis str. Heartland]AHX05726.1 FKBP-type peptidyl-prolyl cis-trans isomerase family protein [Ehrlichia chaffeensis str. Jax]AHX06718.1 FKBP-type peptidyl-prolyl cis-trans isomerase family protein [Ehrlichia chaffeensis str. Liberty]AHX07747.1 FKBP-type peptidyl-prolyl cis-trans iso
MKKIFYRLLYVCLTIVAITLVGKALTILYTKTTLNQHTNLSNKPYKINVNHSLTHIIGYDLLRPIIESRIDYYIKINGLVDYLEHIKHKTIKPDLFKIHDIVEGNGKKALCGQNISAIIHKFLYDSESKNILSQALKNIPQEVTFKLGESIIKELNYTIAGMEEEGERIIILTDQEGNLKEQYYVKLISINSSYPDEVNDILIFNNTIENYEGTVNKIHCGDSVSVKYTVRESNGKVLLEDQELKVEIGKNEAPLAIELGLINMRSDMTRSMIVSPKLFTNFEKPENFDENSIKIIDMNIIE